MATHQPGDTIRLETTFLDQESGTPYDPSTVELTVVTPAGASTTYTYANAEVTRVSTGLFRKDIVASLSGMYIWRWEGDGIATGVDQGSFTVDRDLLVDPGLCSVDDVKANLNLDNPLAESADDELIATLIATASDLIQSEYEREFVPGGIETRTFAVTGSLVDLAPSDIRSVQSITLHPGDDNETVLTADQYVMGPHSKNGGVWSSLTLAKSLSLSSTNATNFGYSLVSIQGTWGFPVVPAPVARACVLTVVSWLRADTANYGNVNSGDARDFVPVQPNGTYSIPLAARRLLDMYRRYVSIAG